ncbi:MAG: nucleotide exchange factor GrpE [Rikenellaceae bacterium]|nr:nucleotide exchange factor GrpE [Rikenellaceae bacterium]
MTKKTAENQVVEEKEGFAQGEGYPNCEGEPCANMAEEEQSQTDTVAEESVAAEQAQEQAQEQTEEAPKVEDIDWKDRYIRLQAEFDNFRKRTLREKMALIESGGSDVWKAVLPVLDDMERAIAASEKSEDITALREGEKLIYNKFVDIMRQKGVVAIEALDAEFNPDLHEAVARFAAGEEKSGKVIDVVQQGYKQGEQVLRYAKVVVGE